MDKSTKRTDWLKLQSLFATRVHVLWELELVESQIDSQLIKMGAEQGMFQCGLGDLIDEIIDAVEGK